MPEHPDYPRIPAVSNEVTGPLRARDVCDALDQELLPKNFEGNRAKLKRLVKLDVLTEVDTGSFTRKQQSPRNRQPCPSLTRKGTPTHGLSSDGSCGA
ncbi:hypothetical protein AB0H86_19400 [Streptomyces sp. NPDC050997]|uniref:hypothetical protein n=1 Tax=Streptomyces sp. NPDC050997 TaxID=3155519 RepID=UPI003439FEBC